MTPTQPKRGFVEAATLLKSAASDIAEAARLITGEAVHAEHITEAFAMSAMERPGTFPQRSPDELSLERLTKLAAELGTHRDWIALGRGRRRPAGRKSGAADPSPFFHPEACPARRFLRCRRLHEGLPAGGVRGLGRGPSSTAELLRRPLQQADALRVLHEVVVNAWWTQRIVAIHASPPCQRHSQMSNCRPGLADEYPDLIDPVRRLLKQTGPAVRHRERPRSAPAGRPDPLRADVRARALPPSFVRGQLPRDRAEPPAAHRSGKQGGPLEARNDHERQRARCPGSRRP
jgi:hypothetical protein